MSVPFWIDEKLLQSLLCKYFNDNAIIISSFSSMPAIPKGENYSSDVFRVNITFIRDIYVKETNKESLSVIIKCTCDGLVEEIMKEENVFHKEVDMFRNVLPRINGIYGVNCIFSPNCVNAFTEPHPMIMIEDLHPLGFKMCERQTGLDLSHALKVLEKIANFHAASIVIFKEKTPTLSNLYLEGIYTKSTYAWIKIGFDALTQMSSTSKDFKTYHEKLKEIHTDSIIESCMTSWHRKTSKFSVLNHGDLNNNNILFCYESNGTVKDCRLVDFQYVVYGSPAIDLHYFIATSLNNKTVENIDHLLDFYYVHLLLALNKLRHNLDVVPPLKEFKEDFQQRAFYGLLAAATVLPLIKVENREDANFEELMTNNSEDSFRYQCYNNDSYKSALLQLLPYYDSLGVFL